MLALILTASTQACFADDSDPSKEAKDGLSGVMTADTLSQIDLLDSKSNFIDPEMRRKFDAALPPQDFAGKPYAYTGLSVTRSELQDILKGGVPISQGALVEHPNEVVSMVYDQAKGKTDTFPVIVQVKDPQGSGPIKPENITGVMLFYNDGFLADAKRPDPGASRTDTHIGTPVFRFKAVPDDSTGQTIVDLQGDLVSTAGGVTKVVRAKEAPAPGHGDGTPQYVTKVMAGESTVSVDPVEGGSFKPFELTGGQKGQTNIAEITKEGAETASNPVLSAEALENSSIYSVVILAITGKLAVDSPFHLDTLLLDPDNINNPDATNVYSDGYGETSVSYQPEYTTRTDSDTTPIVVPGDGDPGGGPGDLAKDAEQHVAAVPGG